MQELSNHFVQASKRRPLAKHARFTDRPFDRGTSFAESGGNLHAKQDRVRDSKTVRRNTDLYPVDRGVSKAIPGRRRHTAV